MLVQVLATSFGCQYLHYLPTSVLRIHNHAKCHIVHIVAIELVLDRAVFAHLVMEAITSESSDSS